jgi:hypothetical protein
MGVGDLPQLAIHRRDLLFKRVHFLHRRHQGHAQGLGQAGCRIIQQRGHTAENRARAAHHSVAVFRQQASDPVDPRDARLPLGSETEHGLQACCSTDFTSTGRMSAHRAASRRASLSARSVLLRRTYGRTYCAGSSRTSWPRASACRPQWCAVPHASIQMVSRGTSSA